MRALLHLRNQPAGSTISTKGNKMIQIAITIDRSSLEHFVAFWNNVFGIVWFIFKAVMFLHTGHF